MWTVLKEEGPPVYYKRKIFEAEDPNYHGTFAVDFVVDPFTESDATLPVRTSYFSEKELQGFTSLDSRPMLVTLHGLSGGSFEVYCRQILAPLIGAEGDKKWEACVVNARGCAMHKITSGVLFNARATWDLRETVLWLRKAFPNRPLFGIGFSLGANILTNYLGEEGSACMLKAAVVCSNPWNLEVGSLALQRTWFRKEVYARTMGSNMKKLMELHVDEISKIPNLDLERVRKTKYLHEFDREVQGPTWGYPTEGSYYRDASSVDALLAARIPLFAINAKDDPIAVNEAIPYEEVKKTPYVVLCGTSLGGHLSWQEIGGTRWNVRPAVNFLNKMAFEVDTDSASPPLGNQKADSDVSIARFDPMRRRWHI